MIRWFAAGTVVLAVALTVLPSSGPAVAGDTAPAWDDIRDTADSLLNAMPDRDWRLPAPESRDAGSLRLLFDSGARADKRIDELLDEAATILATSPVTGLREAVREKQQAIDSLNRQIAEWQVQRAGAPDRDGVIDGLLGRVTPRSRDDYDRRIAAARQDIDGLAAERNTLKTQFREDLQGIGVTLSGEQVDWLLGMVTGDDIVGMLVLYGNLLGINTALAEATRAGTESLDVARRYYGFQTVLLGVAVHAHETFLRKVNDEYLGRLDRIVAETTQLREDTRRSLRAERQPALRAAYESNLAAQDLTLRTADLYRQILVGQARQIAQRREQLQREYDVRVNTYRTVQASSSLVTMMRDSGRAFDGLMRLELPELRPFENIEMQNEFRRLTDQIAAPSS